MKEALIAVPVLLAATACGGGGPGATATSPQRPAAPNTAPPIDRQQRSFACGTSIGGPVSLTGDSDPMHLAITSAVADQDRGLVVTYRITAPDATTKLGVPIGEVPPTALLLKEGKIVANQSTVSPSIDGGPAEGYPVGRRPYQRSLTVDQVCPGTDVRDILAAPSGYRAVVVMSVQGAGAQSGTVVPLWQAIATPTPAG